MDFDILLQHYFGSTEIENLGADGLARGLEALSIDFGTERDPGRRFALWALMQMLGVAPMPDEAFKTQAEREAAWRFMRMARRADEN
ncbi:hypothetical protein [Sphingomonas cavernae]|uniref:Uncharacterized protein n=1 Tax=Sphingomonas cavernae TaxID=2320861 RepID=A0A418W6V3_9SPHN|nr:hypothetical protein [Sphingomonas cavernae]RJF85594.1 hypothetical protein D3876_16895 [Sphingomonas cavernae]